MKFGLALPNSGPLANPHNIERVAQFAESAGFDMLLVHDLISYDTAWLGHRTSGLAFPGDDIDPNLYESLLTLAYIARATTTIRLGTAVLVLPLRDPRVVARQVITLQALSGGRCCLGVGSGDYPQEFNAMQVPYDQKAALTREYMAALATLLPGGRVDFEGPTIKVEGGAFFPRVTPVPLMMGGGIRNNPRSGEPELFEPPLRTLAQWGHGWIPEGPAEIVAAGAKRLAELAAEAGRTVASFEIRPQSPLYIGNDDRQAMNRLGRHNTYELVGTVETVNARLTEYDQAGADAINIRCFADDEASYFRMLAQFADEIMPCFTD